MSKLTKLKMHPPYMVLEDPRYIYIDVNRIESIYEYTEQGEARLNVQMYSGRVYSILIEYKDKLLKEMGIGSKE